MVNSLVTCYFGMKIGSQDPKQTLVIICHTLPFKIEVQSGTAPFAFKTLPD